MQSDSHSYFIDHPKFPGGGAKLGKKNHDRAKACSPLSPQTLEDKQGITWLHQAASN